MSLLELLLLKSGNSRTDFIVLATNIKKFLSCWIFYFFFPCCKKHPDISVKYTSQHNCTLCIKDRIVKCRISISLTVPACLLVAKVQNRFKFLGFSYMKTSFGENVQTNIVDERFSLFTEQTLHHEDQTYPLHLSPVI